MQAIRVHEFGGPNVLQLETVADPQPGSEEVLVRIRAAGINPVDTYIRTGTYSIVPDLPYIPFGDGAGEVIDTGSEVTRFAPGDRVYVAGAATYAEKAAVPEHQVWPLPANVSFEQGATLGVPYATAHRALFSTGEGQAGDWVLIHGASGGVGTAAVQLAAAAGMKVAGTASSDTGKKRVAEQGASVVLDHDALDEALVATSGHGFDLIVEMAAGRNLGNDLSYLAEGGRVVVVGSRGPVQIDARNLMSRTAQIRGFTLFGTPPGELQRIHASLQAGLRSGVLQPVIGKRFALKDAARAHEAILQPGANGNIVLTM